MSEVRIVSTEPCGDLVAVSIEVESDEIFSIEGKRVEAPERKGEFHQGLHGQRITHSHNRRVTKSVVYVEAPFTEQKLAEKLAEVRRDVEATDVKDFACELEPLQERCFVNGKTERDFYRAEACPPGILDTLKERFPSLDLSTLSLISSPSFNEVIRQNVISTFLWEDDVPGLTINGLRLISRSRKFCLEAGKFYDRLYTFPSGSESYPFMPASCKLMARSVNTNIQDGLVLPDFFDLYFSGEHAVVEEAFSLPNRVGAQTTYYGVTVLEGKVVRAKQYCYDRPGIFFDWDGVVYRAAQGHKITPP